jgi:GNAT superfamily N-acetyltransferase
VALAQQIARHPFSLASGFCDIPDVNASEFRQTIRRASRSLLSTKEPERRSMASIGKEIAAAADEPNSPSREKIARAPAALQRFISPMRSEPMATRRIRVAPAKALWRGERRVVVRDRPLIEPEWDMVRDFVRRLDAEDLRLRFGARRDFRDDAILRRAFDIASGVGEIAWVLDEAAAIAGIAHRIMVSPSEAEAGLIVRSDVKRAGIGEFLLRDMAARSARQGLKTLSALVLRENYPMLRLAAKLSCVRRTECPWTVTVVLELGAAPR